MSQEYVYGIDDDNGDGAPKVVRVAVSTHGAKRVELSERVSAFGFVQQLPVGQCSFSREDALLRYINGKKQAVAEWQQRINQAEKRIAQATVLLEPRP